MGTDQNCLKLKESKKWHSNATDSNVDAVHMDMVASANDSTIHNSNPKMSQSH